MSTNDEIQKQTDSLKADLKKVLAKVESLGKGHKIHLLRRIAQEMEDEKTQPTTESKP